MNPLETVGVRSLVQFPHPGPEHRMPRSGLRGWRSDDELHRRTYLSSHATYRSHPSGPDVVGPVEFWGEWEAACRLVRELDPVANGPRWLCEPDVTGEPPTIAEGRPQNTDPFVWGDALRYTFCRQDRNRKLRELGRGSLVLFGSSPTRGFELDTVLVVAGWHAHSKRSDLADQIDDSYRRYTIDPMYSWGEGDRTYRLYHGATPNDPVDGMFSFVPCKPTGDTAGFPRPVIDLGNRLKKGLRMQASVLAQDPHQLKAAWNEVVRQVTANGLVLATRLDLPDGSPKPASRASHG